MSIKFIDELINKDFFKFLNAKEKQISYRTIQRYLSDISYYSENFVSNSVIIDDFDNFFTPSQIKSFLNTRKSSTARATIINFVYFLRSFERLSDTQYVKVTEYIKSLNRTTLENQMEFLSNEQLSFLLSERFEFHNKDIEERIILPILLSFSYFLIFEQDHLINLKWSDIQLDNKRVRNLRRRHEELASEWIKIDDSTVELIVNYRNQLNGKNISNYFLTFNGLPLNNNRINSLLRILKRKDNFKILKTTIDIQKLNRSRIYHSLIETNGRSTFELIRQLGLKRNTQLEHALEEFILNDYS